MSDTEKDTQLEETDEPTAVDTPETAQVTDKSSSADSSVSIRAKAKYVRSSARKARLVCDHIRGKSIPEAQAILANTTRSISEDWVKLLNSAVANAENNHGFDAEELYVAEVFADEGPTIKRSRPRAKGRATPIHKRTCHLSIALKTNK